MRRPRHTQVVAFSSSKDELQSFADKLKAAKYNTDPDDEYSSISESTKSIVVYPLYNEFGFYDQDVKSLSADIHTRRLSDAIAYTC